MFRSRFSDALPSKLPHFGPQDIENGVVDSAPTPEVQQLLCALLGLMLNRKKPVEYVYWNLMWRYMRSPESCDPLGRLIKTVTDLNRDTGEDIMVEHLRKQSSPTSRNGRIGGTTRTRSMAAIPSRICRRTIEYVETGV
jgi:hypothetical protein